MIMKRLSKKSSYRNLNLQIESDLEIYPSKPPLKGRLKVPFRGFRGQ